MQILITGASGFVGTALRSVLLEQGHQLRCASRQAHHGVSGEEWVKVDLQDTRQLPELMRGVDAAYYLVHSMGAGGSPNYATAEQAAALAFAGAAELTGLQRIIYLGGVIPQGPLSAHLESRRRVGETLRTSRVPTLELRASMIIGNGSASWQIVRDLALRLPAMILPSWTRHVMAPVALDDVLVALVKGLTVQLDKSAWFDLPGPELLSARRMMEIVAGLQGRRFVWLPVPWLTPRLSALWLRFVTRTDTALAMELVRGFTQDLLPRSGRYWRLIQHTQLMTFEDAARHALATEAPPRGAGGLEELMVAWASPSA